MINKISFVRHKNIILVLSIIFVANLHAQKEKMLKEIWYKDKVIENKHLKLTIEDALVNEKILKFRLKIENLYPGFLLFKANELVVNVNGQDTNLVGKWILIEALADNRRTFDLKGKDYRSNKFKIKTSGFYLIPNNTKAMPGPDFTLTPNDKEISIGDFKVTMVDLKKETGNTVIKFKLEYTGDRVGLVDPSKIMVMMPDKKEYSQKSSKGTVLAMNKGSKEILIVKFGKEIPSTAGDMQKAEMILRWKDAFKECSPENIVPEILEIEKDDDKTYDKNH